MELTEDQEREIKAIMECSKSEFEVLCKAKDFGVEHYIECLEPELHRCNFSISFDSGYLCTCPLRIYVSKNLKK
ncbi:MAG: hypothetical protein ACYSUD_14885 [Planctomycetota bacterium]|jgi:hypothetical protein